MQLQQDQALQEFVRKAVEQSPFYSSFYASANWDYVKSWEDLSTLPILSKEQLRASMDDIYTVGSKGSIEGHTGGTTGKSLVVRFTIDDMMRRMATLDHFKASHGFENLKMRRATFSGKHVVPLKNPGKVFWRYNASARQMLYSTFHLTEGNLRAYVRGLNEFRPESLDGFFSSMCEVASFILRNDIKLTFRPVAIFPTSETVDERGRQLLQEVFGAPVFDQYASSEGAPFITECSAHKLHLLPHSGIFEQAYADKSMLVTSFTTHGTPLIRYEIGDEISPDKSVACECGFSAPMVRSINGRSDDHLVRLDGTRINGGQVANLFKNAPNSIIRAQVRQAEKGLVVILLQVDQRQFVVRDDEEIRRQFHRAFGDATELTISYVNNIAPEKSGKMRLIKNTVTC